MAFKRSPQSKPVPDSPDELLRELPRRKIPDVLPHQREMMRTYAAEATNVPDVAMQLPTGSGKTLVGLLTAEWRRRKNQERVVYLCPTRQLVNQVVEQADEKYGLTVLKFVGKIQSYDPTTRAKYQSADHIAITTYSSLFNTNPFFDSEDVVVLDDAHAAENYVASLWSVRIERTEHKTLHTALRGVLKPVLEATSFSRLSGQWDSPAARGWIDKLPTPVFHQLKDQVAEVLEEHVVDTELQHPWSMVRDHLHACHMYLSSQEILIRPLIPPTWAHAPFASPKQRIYMSATLGEGGDLERLMGRRSIKRLPIPTGWNRQGVGRRFFIFSGMSLKDEQVVDLRRELMRRAGRSLVLVPSDSVRAEIAGDVADHLKFKTFSAEDIEKSKRPFVQEKKAVAIVAGRYDGIDFPGDECRLLFVDGLPKAMNIQERFLMSRMGANLLFNERIQTRILQAIGRCTRSLEDYSAVVVTGDELLSYLTDIRRRKYFHPELQAELGFGVDQSKGTASKDILENFDTFLENGEEWEEVNQEILAKRKKATQSAFPAMAELQAVVAHEVEFQTKLWQSDFEEALASAESVLGSLTSEELRGYRASWHYFAGSTAWLGAKSGVPGLDSKSRLHFAKAKSAATGIPWLVALSRTHIEPSGSETESAEDVMEQLERVEVILAQLGTVHDRAFAKREKEILDGLSSKDKGPFEQGHRLLGELLGFEAGKVEQDGSPDPWWISGKLGFVFEDHAGADVNSALNVDKARQAATHPNWIRDNVPGAPDRKILPVLVTPVKTVREGAAPHLEGVFLWPIDEFRQWAENAIATIRKLRSSFMEPGSLIWRAGAAEAFEQNALSCVEIRSLVEKRPAKKALKVVK